MQEKQEIRDEMHGKYDYLIKANQGFHSHVETGWMKIVENEEYITVGYEM